MIDAGRGEVAVGVGLLSLPRNKLQVAGQSPIFVSAKVIPQCSLVQPLDRRLQFIGSVETGAGQAGVSQLKFGLPHQIVGANTVLPNQLVEPRRQQFD